MRKKVSVFLCAAVFGLLAGCAADTGNRSDTNHVHLESQSSRNDYSNQENYTDQGIADNLENLKNQESGEKQEKDEKIIALETDTALVNDDKNHMSSSQDGESLDMKKNEDKKQLTLEDVLTLAKQESLDWSDFEGYVSQDVGFGLCILKFDIDDDFYLLVGGTGQGKPMYVRLVSVKDNDKYIEIGNREQDEQEANEYGIYLQAEHQEMDRNAYLSENLERPQESLDGAEEVADFIRENRGTSYAISILAHVKEISENGILISSDTDTFPGVFFVTGVREAMDDEEFWKLKGGVHFRILMEDLYHDNLEYNRIPEYKAKKIVILSDDEHFEQEDILLHNVPELTLIDPLSSKYDPYLVASENYSWTVGENGEEREIIACGAAPLEAAANQKKKLKIPSYYTKSSSEPISYYRYSTKVQPDILTLRQWDIADMDDSEAQEEKITVYYGKTNFIHLQKEKVYEFTAEWKKDNFSKNKFYAKASYVVVTE